MRELKNRGTEEILIFFHIIWLEVWKNVGIENLFILVEKKNKRMDNVIFMILLLCSYYIIYKKLFFLENIYEII